MTQGRPYLDDQREPPALPKSAKLRAAAAVSVTEKLHLAGLLPAIQAICISAGLQVTEVVGRGANGQLSRIKAISQCRGRILAEVRKLRGWSYPHIGNLFGLDHTSVMMAVRKVEQGWGKAEGLIGNSWREDAADLRGTRSEPAVNLEQGCSEHAVELGEPSRALASRASEASLCSSSLTESIPIVAVSEKTRERGTAPQQSGASLEVRDMAARIASHGELSALNALAIASKFEGWRMARGRPLVADALTAIDEYVLTVAGNQAIPANELQRGLVSYMRNARPPKAETAPARPGSSWREQQASAGPGIDYAELKQERVAPAVPSGDVLARLEALGTKRVGNRTGGDDGQGHSIRDSGQRAEQPHAGEGEAAGGEGGEDLRGRPATSEGAAEGGGRADLPGNIALRSIGPGEEPGAHDERLPRRGGEAPFQGIEAGPGGALPVQGATVRQAAAPQRGLTRAERLEVIKRVAKGDG